MNYGVDDQSSPDQQLVKRMEGMHDCTVADIANWCFQHRVSPGDVKVTMAHLKYQTLETMEERDRRMEFWERSKKRHDDWEVREYARLKEKYGDGGPSGE